MSEDRRGPSGEDEAKAEPGHNDERVKPTKPAEDVRRDAARIEEHSEPPTGGPPTRDPG